MNARTNKNGFTIIEVVLVLAIAALIFLMIFVALPALQRGQANTARKNDMSTIASAVNTYRTNNNGSLPTTYSQISNYVDKLSQVDLKTGNIPTGADVTIDVGDGTDGTNLDTAIIVGKARCNGATTKAGTARQAAVLTVVETSAGKYAVVCQDA